MNRMKSNSSRGRSISTDSSVQNLFLNLTAYHSRLLDYIKKADDKRMWYERLQDKLTQIKDSRAALDVLRQEHQEKLRQQAEELERQRQMQMAYKLELMRKKKQEYLQYQRQLALQRIQEQEREMKMHQDQQKVMYHMGVQSPYQTPTTYMQPMPGMQPMHGMQSMPGMQSMTGMQPMRNMDNDSSPAHIMSPNLNSYAHGGVGPMSLPSNMVPPPSTPQLQRYPIAQQQPIYSTVGGQASVAGMHSIPSQSYPNPIAMAQPNIGMPNQAFSPSHLPPQPSQGLPEQYSRKLKIFLFDLCLIYAYLCFDTFAFWISYARF